MKRLKKGPELKMPELKVPPFVSDLYWDLRDRRLLPLIALAVVAIAAVPFLLGGGSETPPAKPRDAIATPTQGAAQAASLTVVQAKPGLRDYRKRLAGRTPTDPFEQRYTAPSTSGAELGSQTENSSDSISSTTTVTTSSNSSSTTDTVKTTVNGSSPGSSSPSGGQTSHHLTFYNWGIDVRIVKAGGKNADPSASPEIGFKHKVLPQTPLPGEKAPVVTYMGLSRKAAENHHAVKALLLVSDDVTSMDGDATCASVAKRCKLLEVSPEVPLTFIYGANETRYTIKILKIALVVTGHG